MSTVVNSESVCELEPRLSEVYADIRTQLNDTDPDEYPNIHKRLTRTLFMLEDVIKRNRPQNPKYRDAIEEERAKNQKFYEEQMALLNRISNI
ncbi:hypothetical protein [Endozoicomonas sp. ONNA1]|uniref:hypothetical protein n=1 Tax=Endozoicomonas sp. ONNA1 TaxID=2828740 RepID=UPI0021488BAB|nr:hypothetical protein [Endozoicomonas sp. ONNA1]